MEEQLSKQMNSSISPEVIDLAKTEQLSKQKNPSIPPEVIKQKNPSIPPEVIKQKNPNISPEVIDRAKMEQLSKQKNPSITPEVIDKLFCNIKEILSAHKALLVDLDREMLPSHSPEARVASCYVKHVCTCICTCIAHAS